MSFLDKFTEEQQAFLIELVRQKFPDKSLQEEDIASEDDDGEGSQTRCSNESDNNGEGNQYCCSDEESEKDDEDKHIQVCSL